MAVPGSAPRATSHRPGQYSRGAKCLYQGSLFVCRATADDGPRPATPAVVGRPCRPVEGMRPSRNDLPVSRISQFAHIDASPPLAPGHLRAGRSEVLGARRARHARAAESPSAWRRPGSRTAEWVGQASRGSGMAHEPWTRLATRAVRTQTTRPATTRRRRNAVRVRFTWNCPLRTTAWFADASHEPAHGSAVWPHDAGPTGRSLERRRLGTSPREIVTFHVEHRRRPAPSGP